MPTPAGKPKVGEFVLTVDGELLGRVTRRSDGESYSVWLQKRGERERIITEFAWWMKQRKWKIVKNYPIRR